MPPKRARRSPRATAKAADVAASAPDPGESFNSLADADGWTLALWTALKTDMAWALNVVITTRADPVARKCLSALDTINVHTLVLGEDADKATGLIQDVRAGIMQQLAYTEAFVAHDNAKMCEEFDACFWGTFPESQVRLLRRFREEVNALKRFEAKLDGFCRMVESARISQPASAGASASASASAGASGRASADSAAKFLSDVAKESSRFFGLYVKPDPVVKAEAGVKPEPTVKTESVPV